MVLVKIDLTQILKEHDKALKVELIIDLQIEPHLDQQRGNSDIESSQGTFADATQHREP